MLRAMVLHAKINEIPGCMKTTPDGMVSMTRKEINDAIDRKFKAAAERKVEES